MKNRIYNLIFIIIIMLSLSVLLLFIQNKKSHNETEDVAKTVSINDLKLNVIYEKGNVINTNISYGNTFEKYISIENNNSDDLTISINIENLNVNNELIKYSLYYQTDETENYKELVKETSLTDKLIYNLIAYKETKMNIKIVFKSFYEQDISLLKGELKVSNNLSSKDIFISKLEQIHSSLLDKINSLNGINESGIYYEKIETDGILGFIIIDAKNISEVKYIYTLYNDKYMIVNYKYKNGFKKGYIKNNDDSLKNMTEDNVCKMYSKKDCIDFNTLNYKDNGGKDNFNNKIKEVIDAINKLNYDKKVYVIDISNDLNISDARGYVLVNNLETTKEIYLYLTNELFMISGYNYTKLGKIDVLSSTIRAYNESAFNLSSKDKKTVCAFSGFSDCFNLQNELI